MINSITVISGKAGAGKDTLAEGLALELINSYNVKFADGVVATTSALYDIPTSVLKSQEGKEDYYHIWGMTGREMLQFVGTDLVRSRVGDDHWVKLVEQLLRHLKAIDRAYSLIFTDVRFSNEADVISKLAKTLKLPITHIHLERPNNSVETSGHVSEDYEVVFPEYPKVTLLNDKRPAKIIKLAKALFES